MGPNSDLIFVCSSLLLFSAPLFAGCWAGIAGRRIAAAVFGGDVSRQRQQHRGTARGEAQGWHSEEVAERSGVSVTLFHDLDGRFISHSRPFDTKIQRRQCGRQC